MKYFLVIPISVILLMSAYRAYAQQTEGLQLLKNVGTSAKYNTAGDDKALAATVGNIIAMSLGLLGVIFLAFTVYAGYLYLTAGGNEEQTKTAVQYMRNALIGLIIVLASYGITKWVVGAMVKSAITAPSPTTPGVNK